MILGLKLRIVQTGNMMIFLIYPFKINNFIHLNIMALIFGNFRIEILCGIIYITMIPVYKLEMCNCVYLY